MKKTNTKYFLAANSCEGFVSKFGECYNPADDWTVYIIKGGPGTGKSSFMKKAAQKANEKNIDCILCPCSSDPDSLDAVILPDKKTVILDGTAPHTLDPVYPAVCEEILNFGEFWNKSKFKDKSQVFETTNYNKILHATASRYLQAAGKLLLDNYKTALACTQKEKAQSFAENLAKRYLPKTDNRSYEWVRFLGSIGPKGIISYPETVASTCKELVIIKDKFGATSNIIMEQIRTHALQNGYEIIAVKNPFLPNTLTDHIIIPSLSLAFVTENDFTNFETDARRIHARRFTSNKQLHLSNERIKFNKKVVTLLLSSAVDTLNKAKAVHDQLEINYIKAMDFTKLNEFAEKFCNNLFS